MGGEEERMQVLIHRSGSPEAAARDLVGRLAALEEALASLGASADSDESGPGDAPEPSAAAEPDLRDGKQGQVG